MKTLLLLLIAGLTLMACTKDEITKPTPNTCAIGHIIVLQLNIRFIRDIKTDTIWFRFQHPDYGWIPGFWDNSTNWDCIGFTRTDVPFDLIVWTRQDTCTFTISAIQH